MQYYDPKLKTLSRKLRNHSTLSEILLWNQLKSGKMLGYYFQRQKPISKYIVDFYCPLLSLVLEIDGESHRGRYKRDLERDEDLRRLGLHVLRFEDRDVKRDMGNVLTCIQNWIEKYEKSVSTRKRRKLTTRGNVENTE